MKQDIMLISQYTKQSKTLCAALRAFKMDISQVETYQDIFAMLTLHSPAFILLDVEIKDAKLLLTKIVGSAFRPPPYIIVADAFLESENYIALLNLGADICVRKPVSAREILAIIHAVLRRERRIMWPNRKRLLPCIHYKGLKIDPLRRTVIKAEQKILLTAKEFDVLYILADHMDAVLTKEEIYQSVWGENYQFSSSNVARIVSSLRQKLGLDIDGKDYIQTIFGIGYRFGNIE